MTDLLIIGGASLDRLHFSGQIAQAAGGAGMYTAAAAKRLGVDVTMFAPRPNPMPDVLQPLDDRIEWLGPEVIPEDLPQFEIAHHRDGRTELVKASFGSEILLDPSSLPEDLSSYRLVHITPVGAAHHQMECLEVCRQRGAKRISAGTSPCIAEAETECVRAILQLADLFFMNEEEAIHLFGSVRAASAMAGKLLFVTMGDRGALVIQGEHRTQIAAIDVMELDPTGAGDSFCGATLAGVIHGLHPVMAARRAADVAAQVVRAVGPNALWEDGSFPEGEEDQRVRVVLNPQQIGNVAALIRSLPDIAAFDFTGPALPPVDHPKGLDYFFAATLQQFGFWYETDGKYQAPLIAYIDGVEAKGSDYLGRAYLRILIADDEGFFAPQHQANLTREELLAVFKSDDGTNPLPAADLYLAQARSYGQDMLRLKLSPADVCRIANESPSPLRSFFECLNHIGGYMEDPLRKKAALLAMILSQRPERFLHVGPEGRIPPIIDYHLMRSCLRIGLLDVVDGTLRGKLVGRQVLHPDDEWAVRHAAYRALLQLVEFSGKDIGSIDWFFFNARRRCPEMSEPACELCPVDPVCTHRKKLFQPVMRTTFY